MVEICRIAVGENCGVIHSRGDQSKRNAQAIAKGVRMEARKGRDAGVYAKAWFTTADPVRGTLDTAPS